MNDINVLESSGDQGRDAFVAKLEQGRRNGVDFSACICTVRRIDGEYLVPSCMLGIATKED